MIWGRRHQSRNHEAKRACEQAHDELRVMREARAEGLDLFTDVQEEHQRNHWASMLRLAYQNRRGGS